MIKDLSEKTDETDGHYSFMFLGSKKVIEKLKDSCSNFDEYIFKGKFSSSCSGSHLFLIKIIQNTF